MEKIKIAFGADHAGFALKKHFVELLKEKGYNCLDLGCFSEESVDYPDFVHPVANLIESGLKKFQIFSA